MHIHIYLSLYTYIHMYIYIYIYTLKVYGENVAVGGPGDMLTPGSVVAR